LIVDIYVVYHITNLWATTTFFSVKSGRVGTDSSCPRGIVQ